MNIFIVIGIGYVLPLLISLVSCCASVYRRNCPSEELFVMLFVLSLFPVTNWFVSTLFMLQGILSLLADLHSYLIDKGDANRLGKPLK